MGWRYRMVGPGVGMVVCRAGYVKSGYVLVGYREARWCDYEFRRLGALGC